MRFLVDECTGPAVAEWLRGQGHKVFSVYDEARGLDDEAIIRRAFTENWILITRIIHKPGINGVCIAQQSCN